jgi:hypothetical protein
LRYLQSGLIATVHRNSRCSFRKTPVTKRAALNKVTVTDTKENKGMGAIISLRQTCTMKFTLSQGMEYDVTDECLPIFNINGTMKKVQKSKLVDKLHMEAIQPEPDMYIVLVDMGFYGNYKLHLTKIMRNQMEQPPHGTIMLTR